MAALRTLAEIAAYFRQLMLAVGSTTQTYRNGWTGDTPSNTISITALANNTLSRLCVETLYNTTETSISASSGVVQYALPQEILLPRSVYLPSARRLLKTTIEEIDARYPNSRAFTGTPNQYYIIGTSGIGFYPTPASDIDITVVAVTSPPDLVAQTDIPSGLPAVFLDYLPYGMAEVAATMDASVDSNGPRMEFYRQQWQEGKAFLKRSIEQTSFTSDASPRPLTPVNADGQRVRPGA